MYIIPDLQASYEHKQVRSWDDGVETDKSTMGRAAIGRRTADDARRTTTDIRRNTPRREAHRARWSSRGANCAMPNQRRPPCDAPCATIDARPAHAGDGRCGQNQRAAGARGRRIIERGSKVARAACAGTRRRRSRPCVTTRSMIPAWTTPCGSVKSSSGTRSSLCTPRPRSAARPAASRHRPTPRSQMQACWPSGHKAAPHRSPCGRRRARPPPVALARPPPDARANSASGRRPAQRRAGG